MFRFISLYAAQDNDVVLKEYRSFSKIPAIEYQSFTQNFQMMLKGVAAKKLEASNIKLVFFRMHFFQNYSGT